MSTLVGYFWWIMRSYIAKTAIFKIWVFWLISMYSITLYVIAIHDIRCLKPFLPLYDHFEIWRFLGLPNQTYKTKPTKPNQTKLSQPGLPNQTYQIKSTKSTQNYWLKQSTPRSLMPLSISIMNITWIPPSAVNCEKPKILQIKQYLTPWILHCAGSCEHMISNYLTDSSLFNANSSFHFYTAPCTV